jgi:hypothetical protein
MGVPPSLVAKSLTFLGVGLFEGDSLFLGRLYGLLRYYDLWEAIHRCMDLGAADIMHLVKPSSDDL